MNSLMMDGSAVEQVRWCALEDVCPGSPAFVRVTAIRADGPLDTRVVRACINEIGKRHAALRLAFPRVNGQRVSTLSPVLDIPFDIVLFEDLTEQERETEVRREVSDEIRRPFDLEDGPLVRARILCFGEGISVILFSAHAAVFDEPSSSILIRELSTSYRRLSSPRPTAMHSISPGSDSGQWLQQWLQGRGDSVLAFWKERLAGDLPTLSLATDRPHPAARSFRAVSVSKELPGALVQALEGFRRREDVSLSVILLAAWNLLLHRYTGQDDILVGTPTPGRSRPESKGMIGRFEYPIVLRTQMSGSDTATALLRRVAEVSHAAEANRDLPFGTLLAELKPPQDLSRHPLFQASFEVLEMPAELVSSTGIAFRRIPLKRDSTDVDLALSVTVGHDAITMTLTASGDIFDSETIAMMSEHYRVLLSGIVGSPERPVSVIPMMTEAERRKVLVEWNNTQTGYPRSACIHELFEEQVERSPDAIAASFQGEELTYRELNRRANRFARRLREQGVGPDVPVGIFVERSLDMLVGLVGILKAGGAYLPLDAEYPDERLRMMLEDAGAPVLVVKARWSGKPAFKGKIVSFADESGTEEQAENLPSAVGPSSLAYVMFTSGSTGRPKGVAVPHRAVVRLVRDTNYVSFTAEDRVMHASNLSFDASTFEIWGALLNGGRLILIPKDTLLLHDVLAARIREEAISVMFLSTALFHQLAGLIPDAFGGLRYLVIGGDALHPKWCREVLRSGAPGHLVNGYGPTENTTFSTAHWVRDVPEDASSVPIGRPISNSTVYVLDRSLQPVPVGVPGELYVGGDGVARGYLNLPTLTAERFIRNPFSGDPADRLYKTGDQVRWLRDGTIEFLGRLDHQVKVRGFRIELEEIETVLRRHVRVEEAVVTVREDVPGDRRVVAYVTARVDPAPTAAELRSFLGDKLPSFMVPSTFVALSRLPLTPNGKVDRRALPAPARDALAQTKPRVDPKAVEEALAKHPEISAAMVIQEVDQRLSAYFVRSGQRAPSAADLRRFLKEDSQLDAVAQIELVSLAFEHERLFAIAQEKPGSSVGNCLAIIRLDGALDIKILKGALDSLTQRHPALRTALLASDGRLRRSVERPTSIGLNTLDLTLLPEFERDEEVARQASEELSRPMDLSSGRSVRVSLLRFGRQANVLLLAVHSALFDEGSLEVFVKDLAAAYLAYLQGQPPFSAAGPQGGELVPWQRQWLKEAKLSRHLTYWKELLSGDLPVLDLPTDHPRPQARAFQVEKEQATLPPALVEALEALGRDERGSLFSVLLAAYSVLLFRYTGQEDILVGSPFTARDRPWGRGVIDRVEHPIVLRARLSGGMSFRDLVQQIEATSAAAALHGAVPFAMLLEEFAVSEDASRHPIYQAAFELRPASYEAKALGLSISTVGLERAASGVDLLLSVKPSAEGLTMTLLYNAELFEPSTAAGMLSHLRTLLDGAVEDRGRSVSALPLLTAEERRTILVDWNATRTDYPRDACVHELFEAQVRRSPGSIAATFEGQEITYEQLNQRANRLARELLALGVGPDVPVAIFAERSLEMLVGLLAILKAGGAYVPLDPDYPTSRLTLMLETSAAPVLLARRDAWEKIPFTGKYVDLEGAASEGPSGAEDAENPRSGATAESLAYVIFTSGSTGRPKGVAVPHRGVVRLVMRTNYVEFTPADRVLCASNLSFDASTFEIWGALLNGSRLSVITKETLLSPKPFEAAVIGEGITVMFLSTALFHNMAGSTPEVFRGLEHLVIGGDALDPTWCQEVLEKGPPKRLVNGYGPTENTTFSTAYHVRDIAPGTASVPIGQPISNSQAYVLDALLQPVPPGVAGELYLGGDGLARGYMNNPALTAERFVKNPFEGSSHLYKTGDRARYLQSGVIEFLGRLDNQVKIRGFRVEPGEIEAALTAHPLVREAAVTVWEETAGDKKLVAYAALTAGAEASSAALRSFLQDKLPAYMLPAHVIVLDRLPMTPNGKLDRRALPPPGLAREDAAMGLSAPRTQLEDALSQMWGEALGLNNVGIHEGFLDLGGHSLAAVQLLARIYTTYRVEVSIRAFYEARTVAGLASLVDAAMKKGIVAPDASRIRRISRDKPLLLSFSQQQLWILCQVDPNVPFYNEPVTIRIPGPLSVDALERSLQEMIRRHEILRTTFAKAQGSPVQIIHPTSSFKMGFVDLRDLPEAEREGAAVKTAEKEAREPLNLEHGPCFRATLVQLSDEDHRLYVTMHHIMTDGVSFHSILFKELSAIYAAFVAGEPSPLPDLPLQFADYAFWHRKTYTVEALEPHIQYWDRKLTDLTVLGLPTDRPRPALQRFRGAKRYFSLDGELMSALKALSRREDATLYVTLVAAFKLMLSRYAGHHDIVIGTPTSTRSLPVLEHIFGFFVNLIVLRTDLSGDPIFRELIRRVRDVVLDAQAHQDVPFEMLVDELRVQRTRSHNPIFQVAFILEPPLPPGDLGWTMSQHEIDTGTSKFDLSLAIDQRPDGAIGRIEYDTALFDAATIERMMGHFQNVLKAVAESPELRVSDVPMMSDAERKQVLSWNEGRGSFPKDLPLHDLFTVQTFQSPGATAVIYEGSRLTYRELDSRANMLASYLAALGVGTEVRVALFIERSIEMVVAILAVLKAGGAYVPIDPDEIPARRSAILQDAKPAVILTQASLAEKLDAPAAPVVRIDADWPTISCEPDSAPVTYVGPDNVAYIMYTSGTTGRPKGVMVTHHNIVRLFKATWDTFEFTSRDVWTLFHSYAFDFSVWEIWGALLHGGRLIVVPQSVTRSPEAFYGLIRTHKVTVLNLIPSAFLHLMQVDESSEEPAPLSNMTLRIICLGGESFDFSTLRPWIDRHGDRFPRLFNVYGLTGATVFVTFRQVTVADVFQVAGNRIGLPLPDSEVYILDSRRRPVPIGIAGEVHIGGDGLARGYFGRTALTAERFIRHPFRSDPSARLHTTGDLARHTADGDIEFMGRMDERFKVRGFRVEPREVEASLIEHPDVREAVVMVREDTVGDQRLVAYYVKRSDRVPTTNELRGFLKEKLPDYQVPTVFVLIPTIPRAATGKINRHSLPPPDRNRPSLAPIFRLPSSPVEILLLGIWTRLLKVDQIGVKDDFFSLGGHSLLAAQMITRVRETFRIDISHSSFLLRQFLEDPTISGLAEVVEMVRDATPSVRGRRSAAVKYVAEAALDASLRFDAPKVDTHAEPTAIFLTGATGFLGAFLLSELLEQTKADIYCLVRASDIDSGFEKLRRNLEQNLAWNEQHASRIIPVLGDLSQLLVGLSPEKFMELSRKIDVIYHNGAHVNFIYPYVALRPSNVGGTREIIRLATQTRMKPVHYISTLAVLSSYGFFGVRRAMEDVPLDHADHLYMGYAESKWVAEKLLLNASREGLPVAIYRPHDVTGHSVTGAWKTEGFLCSFLKALVELKRAPRFNLPMDFVPVDYVAKAILHIARTKEPNGTVYHLNNPEYGLLPSMLQRMRDIGYDIQTVPYHEWVQKLVDYTAKNPMSAVAPFVPLFVERWSEAQISLLEMYVEERIPVFDCTNTLNALKGTDITCPPVDDRLMAKYLDYFLRIGFLPPPGVG